MKAAYACLLLIAFALSFSEQIAGSQQPFTADAVWLSEMQLREILDSLRERCPATQRETSTVCVESFMRDHGASAQAIRFTRATGGETFATAFHKVGRVDMIEAANPFRANSNEQVYFANGTPALIDAGSEAWSFYRSNNDAKLVAFRKQYPQAYLKHVQGTPKEQPPQGGGQRFLQRFWICYPCPSYFATATLAFDFDENGAFLGTVLVSIEASEASP